jgi:hypothetical protein
MPKAGFETASRIWSRIGNEKSASGKLANHDSIRATGNLEDPCCNQAISLDENWPVRVNE